MSRTPRPPRNLQTAADSKLAAPALSEIVDSKVEATLVADLWAQLDVLHDAMREAYTDHTIYPMKDTPATCERAQRLYSAMFRFGVMRGLLLVRVEAVQDPADVKAFARIDVRFGALLSTHPMPPLENPNTVH